MRPDSPRPLYAGPDEGPELPFPVKVSGKVIKGFGRGSKEVREAQYVSLSVGCSGSESFQDANEFMRINVWIR